VRVDTIMTTQVHTCSAADTLAEAARLMWDRDCGCLPVCAAENATRVVGMITDRDICMAALFAGRPLHELRVAEAMSRQLLACRSDDSLLDAENAMRRARIRRLPVVDEHGILIGIISLADLAREAAREDTHPKRDVTEAEVSGTLAAICESAVAPLPH